MLAGEEAVTQHAEPAMQAAMYSLGSQGGAAVIMMLNSPTMMCVFVGEDMAMQHAEPAMQAAMHSLGSQGGAAVLRHYR